MRKPEDLIGKRVGIQTTGAVLLRALLAKNKIAEKDVKVVSIGAAGYGTKTFPRKRRARTGCA